MDERLRRELWETDAIAAFELRWQVHLDEGRLDRLHALAAGGRSIEVTVSSLQPYTFMVSWVDILGGTTRIRLPRTIRLQFPIAKA